MVRGGFGDPAVLARAAENCAAEWGRPGLTVFAGPWTRPVLLAAARIKHATVRFGWLDCLTGAGFEVTQTGAPPHHTVWLPDVTERTLDAFLACFEVPMAVSSVQRAASTAR